MTRSTLQALLAAAVLLAGPARAEPPQPDRGADLRAKYEEYRGALTRNDFGKPLHLVSTEDARSNTGEVYAVIEMPFAAVATGFANAAQWCDVLILPFNTKHCRAAAEAGKTLLLVRIGRKSSQPPEDAYRLDFRYQAQALGLFHTRSKRPRSRGHARLLHRAGGDRAMRRLSSTFPIHTASHDVARRDAGLSRHCGSGKVGFTVTGKDGRQAGLHRRDAGRHRAQCHALFPRDRGYLGSPRLRERNASRRPRLVRGHRALPASCTNGRGEYLAMKEAETKRSAWRSSRPAGTRADERHPVAMMVMNCTFESSGGAP
jgi:hypothetical protein